MVTIPEFKTVEQVRENAGAFAYGHLTPDDVQQVQAKVAAYQVG